MFHHDFANINGIKLHYVRAGNGAKTIIFLHGFPEFWFEWRDQLADFGRDFTAIAYDQRGYNLSDKPADVSSYSISQIVADIKGIFEFFGLSSDHKGILVAHDWGGAAAWAFAMHYPQYLEKLIIINAPHPGIFARELTTNPAQQKASAYMQFFRSPEAESHLSTGQYKILQAAIFEQSARPDRFTPEIRSAYIEAWSQPGALTGGLNWYRAANFVPSSDVSSNPMLTVRVPTLVLWGEQDTALLTGCLEGLENYVPDLTVVRIPHGTHWVVHEEPEFINQQIRDFIGAK